MYIEIKDSFFVNELSPCKTGGINHPASLQVHNGTQGKQTKQTSSVTC